MKKVFFFLMVALVCASCNNKPAGEIQKKGSSGKTLEMLVVADQEVYRGEAKALIDSIFGSVQPCLPVPESRFDIVNIPMSSYQNTEMFKVHRNVVLLDVRSDNPDKVYKHIDEYAAPQVILDFAAKDRESLCRMIREHGEMMLDEMYKAEHRRVIKAFKGMEGPALNKQVKDKFGFGLMFSNEFAWAKEADDFAWVRKEAKDFGIGLLIDVMPYENQNVFEEMKILDHIDTIMKRHVPASAPDSYTGIERRRSESGEYLAEILSRNVDFNGSEYAVETRGCWRSFGDHMGGPFVAYTILSPDKKKVVTLMGYVYCPRNKPWTKRDLLMQMESVCWSLEW